MKRIIFAVILLVSIFAGSLYVFSQEKEDASVHAKLDKILENQQTMLDYLKFIKNRSR